MAREVRIDAFCLTRTPVARGVTEEVAPHNPPRCCRDAV